MVYYLLSPEQVNHILGLMGYKLGEPREIIRKNYEYYIQRTTHGSTLSYVVHASILRYLKTHRKDMEKWFLNALESDIYDTQEGTTPEGIHCGVMAGTIEVIIKSFAGINLFKDSIHFDPFLPEHWQFLAFKIEHRANLFEVTINQKTIIIKKLNESIYDLGILVEDKRYKIGTAEQLEIPYTHNKNILRGLDI
jgi:trehalose/maltose hydrolase-like predicted phosphorylase